MPDSKPISAIRPTKIEHRQGESNYITEEQCIERINQALAPYKNQLDSIKGEHDTIVEFMKAQKNEINEFKVQRQLDRQNAD